MRGLPGSCAGRYPPGVPLFSSCTQRAGCDRMATLSTPKSLRLFSRKHSGIGGGQIPPLQPRTGRTPIPFAFTWQHDVSPVQDKLADWWMDHQRRAAAASPLDSTHTAAYGILVSRFSLDGNRRHRCPGPLGRQYLPYPPKGIDRGEDVVAAVGVEEERRLGGHVKIHEGTGGELDYLYPVLGVEAGATERRSDGGGGTLPSLSSGRASGRTRAERVVPPG